MSERTFETENIDLSSYLVTAGYQPAILRKVGSNRAVFCFPETADLLHTIVEYERGAALPAKRLLHTRSYLFREAGRVVREGGAR